MHMKAEWLQGALGKHKELGVVRFKDFSFLFSFIEHLLVARLCAKGLTCFTSLNPHNNLMRSVLLSVPFCG